MVKEMRWIWLDDDNEGINVHSNRTFTSLSLASLLEIRRKKGIRRV